MKTILSILSVCAALVATQSSAATVVSGVIVEGPNVTLPGGSFYDNPTVLGDFSNAVGDPILSFSDNAWIFGHVYDCCTDGFTIEATDYSYTLQISALNGSNGFEMGVVVDADASVLSNTSTVLSWNIGSGTSTEVALTGLTGDTEWLVDIVNYEVAAVPLPASSLLLLAGLGGLGAMSRRKKKA